MKKLFLVCLMMLAGSAWAEWVMYSKDEEITFHFDPATIRKDGNMRRVWELQDFGKRNKDGEMSLRARVEYDCKQESYRVLGFSTHSQPLAGGTVLGTWGEDNKWMAIAPRTIAETLLNIVCAQK
jgi:hypothetical protein